MYEGDEEAFESQEQTISPLIIYKINILYIKETKRQLNLKNTISPCYDKTKQQSNNSLQGKNISMFFLKIASQLELSTDNNYQCTHNEALYHVSFIK